MRFSLQQPHLAGRPVDPHAGTVRNETGGLAGSDDPRDRVLMRHDRSMAELAAPVCDDRAEQRQDDG
jgi:hypothetical protein